VLVCFFGGLSDSSVSVCTEVIDYNCVDLARVAVFWLVENSFVARDDARYVRLHDPFVPGGHSWNLIVATSRRY